MLAYGRGRWAVSQKRIMTRNLHSCWPREWKQFIDVLFASKDAISESLSPNVRTILNWKLPLLSVSHRTPLKTWLWLEELSQFNSSHFQKWNQKFNRLFKCGERNVAWSADVVGSSTRARGFFSSCDRILRCRLQDDISGRSTKPLVQRLNRNRKPQHKRVWHPEGSGEALRNNTMNDGGARFGMTWDKIRDLAILWCEIREMLWKRTHIR